MNKFIDFMRAHKDVLMLVMIGLIVRLLFVTLPPFKTDMDSFIAWGNQLHAVGFSRFYSSGIWTDYAPGYFYFLWFVTGITNLFVPSATREIQEFLLKLVPIATDIASALVLYLLSRRSFEKSSLSVSIKRFIAFGIALVYLLLPVTFFNSAIWGQVDSVFTFFLGLSLLMLNSRRFSLAAVFYVIATVIKPQAVIVAPAYALFYLNSLSFRAIITHAIYGAATFFAITFPFFGLSSVQQLYQVLNSSINTYPYGSINTFNIWGLYGFWKSDTTLFAFGLTQQQFGSLLFLCIATVTFCSLLILGKKKAHDIQMLYFSLYSSFLVLIGVLVLTRMHERYVFPFFFYALAGFIYFLSLHSTSLTRISRSTIRVLLPAFVGIYAILVGIHVVNLYYVYVYYIYFNIGVPAENTLFFAIENSLVLWSNMQILFTLLYVTVIGIILVNVRKAHHGS